MQSRAVMRALRGPISVFKIPPALNDLILECLSKDPDLRTRG